MAINMSPWLSDTRPCAATCMPLEDVAGPPSKVRNRQRYRSRPDRVLAAQGLDRIRQEQAREVVEQKHIQLLRCGVRFRPNTCGFI